MNESKLANKSGKYKSYPRLKSTHGRVKANLQTRIASVQATHVLSPLMDERKQARTQEMQV